MRPTTERAREAVQSRTGRPASDRELAAELGIGLRELRHAGRPLHLVSVDDLGETSVPGGGGVRPWSLGIATSVGGAAGVPGAAGSAPVTGTDEPDPGFSYGARLTTSSNWRSKRW